MSNGSQPLSIAQLKEYAVNRQDQYEITRQPLYDTLTYPAAGSTTLTFFQNPIGQNGKTKEDTNLESAGQLPAPKYFLIESIELRFFPGVLPVTSVATPAAAADGPSFFTDDTYTFQKAGYLELFIGSKAYLDDGPMGKFPPKTKLETEFATSTDAGASAFTIQMDYAALCGRPYFIDPQITLIPNQNFSITLNWPNGAQALPSGQAARVQCAMDGLLYRLSQ